MQIGIVDYGAGNILSVYNSIYNLGYDPTIIENSEQLNRVDKIIIPGVGSAFKTINTLEEKGFIKGINKFYESGKPILGICLGFQIFASKLFENGTSRGIGLIKGNVESIEIPQKFNIGWCEVDIDEAFASQVGINMKSDFYFCHSYYLNLKPNIGTARCLGTTFFKQKIPSIVVNNNFIGTQFHPEKSQGNGIKFLKYFLKSKD